MDALVRLENQTANYFSMPTPPLYLLDTANVHWCL